MVARLRRPRFLLAVSLVSLVSLVMTQAAPEAAACQPLQFSVEYWLPIDEDVVPLDASMLAYVVSPASLIEDKVSLRTFDGESIPVEVVIERIASNEGALVRGWPVEPLEPHSTYIWSIDGWERAFVTGDAVDDQPPSYDGVVVTKGGIKSAIGCFGFMYQWREYSIEVTGLDEPVALYARYAPTEGKPWDFALAYDAPLRTMTPLEPVEDQCYELFLEDHGGNVVSIGETCLGLVASGDDEEEGSDSDDGGVADDDGETEDGDTSGAGFDESEKACACRADRSPGSGALMLMLLAGLGLRRRRER
jgi:MYXO-CTERM domain-containing protein